MEALGAFPDTEWDSFAAIFSSHDHLIDHHHHHLSLHSFPMELQNSAPAIISDDDLYEPNNGVVDKISNWFYSLDSHNPNLHCFKQDMMMSCSSCSTDSTNNLIYENYSNLFMSIDDDDQKNFAPVFPDVIIENEAISVYENGGTGGGSHDIDRLFENVARNELISQKRKLDDNDDLRELSPTDAKKKPRVSTDAKNKNKKCEKFNNSRTSRIVEEEEGEGGANYEGESSNMSYSSEDENNTSHENEINHKTSISTPTPTPTSNGKTRANRGSATDPQSLYARKRREKINERLRILQKLVPNGTKVDISTMLEEAVHYVKFLQLQIKLLSSDEMWMYAPLAYNGMDIGLHHKISPFLSH